MILHDTPYGEIYDAIKDEETKVAFAMRKQEERDTRALIRQGRLGGLIWNEYTVPASHNRYLLITEMRSDGLRVFTHSEPLLSLTDDGGKKMYMRTTTASGTGRNGDKITDHRLEVFTAHCLHRFRERTGLPSTLPTERVLWQLLKANVNIAKIHHKLVSRDSREYGCAYQSAAGLFLGTEVDCSDRKGGAFCAVRYNTFVSNELLKRGQVKHLLPKDLLACLDENCGLNDHLE